MVDGTDKRIGMFSSCVSQRARSGDTLGPGVENTVECLVAWTPHQRFGLCARELGLVMTCANLLPTSAPALLQT